MSSFITKVSRINTTRLNLFFIGIIILMIVIAYTNTLGNEFTNWDDEALIVNNNGIRTLNWESVKDIFRYKLQGGTYQPFRVLSYAIDYKFWKLDPLGYHIHNILLHGIASVFLYLSLILGLPQIKTYCFTGVSQPGENYTKLQFFAFFAAVLFAIHPVNVESVTWLSSRKYVLLAAFSFSSFYFFIKSVKENAYHLIYNVVSILLFIGAAFSSPFGVVLPALFFLFLYCRDAGNNPFSIIRQNIKPLLFYLIMGGIVFSMLWYRLVISSQGAAQFQLRENPIDTLVTMCQVAFDYAKNFICPFWLNNRYVDYTYLSFGDTYKNIAGLVLMLSMGIWVLWAWAKGNKFVLFIFGWVFISWLPVSNIIPISTTMADRYVYVTSAGVILIILYAFMYIPLGKITQGRFDIFFFLFFFSIVCIFTVLTIQRNRVWENSGTLWTDSIKKDNQNFLAHTNLGTYLFKKKGQAEEAMKHYRIAHLLNPEQVLPLINQGIVFFNQGKYNKAISIYKKILQLKPEDLDAYSMLGKLYYLLEDNEQASFYFSKVLENNENDGDAMMSRGNALYKMGQMDKAIELYKQGIELYPENAGLAYNLGIAYSKSNQLGMAITFLRKSIKLKPSFAEAYNELGLVFEKNGDLENAENQYKAALELNASFAEAYNNLGNIMFAKEKLDAAEDYYSDALKLNEDLVNSRFNLCVVMEKKGQVDAAFSCYKKLVAKWPDHAESLNNMGSLLVKRKKVDQAEIYFKKAIEINDQYSTPYLNLAELFRMSDNFQKALPYYEKYIMRTTDIQSLRDVGLMFNGLGKKEYAIRTFEKIIKLKTTKGDDFFNLGVLYAQKGENKKAYFMFKQALVIEPDNQNAKNILSRIIIEKDKG